jgi:hypothetical protein
MTGLFSFIRIILGGKLQGPYPLKTSQVATLFFRDSGRGGLKLHLERMLFLETTMGWLGRLSLVTAVSTTRPS